MQRDYASQGVKFFYVYKALAHPETNGYVAPFNLKERLMHIKEAKKKLGTRFSWICDTMKNDLKHALGDCPNSEFVIDPKGRVVRKRVWSRPEQLRRDLEQLIGKVDSITGIADLGLPRMQPAQQVKKGVVPRLRLTGRMMPLKIEPVLDGTNPFYVKLRAEADLALVNRGEGKLYLGFFLDPLYRVHWNNKVAPIQFSIRAPSGVTVTPSQGQGPKPKAAADSDPREFLIDVVAGQGDSPLIVTVQYFACDDAETFCHAVTQKYKVTLNRDPDGGNRRTPGRRGGRMAFGDRRAMIQRLLASDRNNDGRISRAEAPERFRRFMFDRVDRNNNGYLDENELAFMRRRMGGRPPADATGVQRLTQRLFRTLDRNGDGVVSSAEIAAAAKSLRALDRDGDGTVSAAELQSRPSVGTKRSTASGDRFERYVRGLMKRYDRNEDGVLSQLEGRRMRRSPAAADANKDGKITPAELVKFFRSK